MAAAIGSAEEPRPVRDLVGAFARFSHLPKMLNRQAIMDTIVRGCEEGYFVARLPRPDKSAQTWWRQAPPAEVLDDPQLDVVLPDRAELASLSASLVRPGAIDDLWKMPRVTVAQVREFFEGKHVMTVSRGAYEEPMPVPRVAAAVVDEAIRSAVADGHLWLTTGPASLLGEEVSPALVGPDAVLQAPPDPISPLDLFPATLPDAWKGTSTDALALTVALSKKTGQTLPWTVVRDAIDGVIRGRMLERAAGGGEWPCDFSRAAAVTIVVPAGAGSGTGAAGTGGGEPGDSTTRVSQPVSLKANQFQDLVDLLPDLLNSPQGRSWLSA